MEKIDGTQISRITVLGVVTIVGSILLSGCLGESKEEKEMREWNEKKSLAECSQAVRSCKRAIGYGGLTKESCEAKAEQWNMKVKDHDTCYR